ncbi:AAA family ATPase [Candidatus Woesebacteria bacterium]|nr:AAA family ATPase [Candidatus Woesebacteria bacterium]
MGKQESDWVILFGTPGVGKTSVAKLMQNFGYHYYEADDDLLPEVIELNRNNKGLTPELRDRQHEAIFERVSYLTEKHNKFVMSYDFMLDRYRLQLYKMIPSLRWVYLTTDSETLKQRVDRPGHILTPEFAMEIYEMFEEPSFEVKRVDATRNINDVVAEVLKI